MSAPANGQNGAAQEKGRPMLDVLRDWRKWMESDAVQDQLRAVASSLIRPERLIRNALTSMYRTPRLMDCSQGSMLLALMEAGALGLEPTGVVGHGYLVPRWNKDAGELQAHFDIGYKGLIVLAMRHPDVLMVDTGAVREGDTFEFSLGANPKLHHLPDMTRLDPDPESISHVYAIGWLRDAPHPVVVVMSRAQVEAIRQRSQAKGFSPWQTDWEPMALKTAVRRLCGWKLPLETEAQAAIAKIDALDTGDGPVELAAYAPHLGLPAPTPAHPLEQDRPTRTDAVGERLRANRERTTASTPTGEQQ